MPPRDTRRQGHVGIDREVPVPLCQHLLTPRGPRYVQWGGWGWAHVRARMLMVATRAPMNAALTRWNADTSPVARGGAASHRAVVRSRVVDWAAQTGHQVVPSPGRAGGAAGPVGPAGDVPQVSGPARVDRGVTLQRRLARCRAGREDARPVRCAHAGPAECEPAGLALVGRAVIDRHPSAGVGVERHVGYATLAAGQSVDRGSPEHRAGVAGLVTGDPLDGRGAATRARPRGLTAEPRARGAAAPVQCGPADRDHVRRRGRVRRAVPAVTRG